MSDPQTLASEIKAAWRGSTASILAACTKAAEAKQAGCLMEVSGLLAGTVDRSTLVKLARIGETQWPADAADKLPPHWGTIYEIAKLADTAGGLAVHWHEVTPGLQRRTIAVWRNPPVPTVTIMSGPGNQPTPVAPRQVTFDGMVEAIESMRNSGKPGDFVGKVKPARLQMAIAFLQAVLSASQQSGATP